MDLGAFLTDNKELVATVGSVFVAILGVAAALIGRRARVVHVMIKGEKPPGTALPAIDEAAEPPSELLLDLPLMLQSEADQKPPQRMPGGQPSSPVAAPPDRESAHEAVRAAEVGLRLRDTLAREAQPALPLTVNNRLRRELSRDPEGDLKLLGSLAEDVLGSTLLPYLERLADVERAWRALAAARELLDRTATTPRASELNGAGENGKRNSFIP